MEDKINKILIVDDDEDILLAAKMLLKHYAKDIILEKNPQRIPFWINNEAFDVILLDMNFSHDTTSGKEGLYWLGEIMQRDPNAVVIMITAFGEVQTAVETLKLGATDFVLKPWQNEKMIATVHVASKLRTSLGEVKTLKDAKKQLNEAINQPFSEMLGESQAIAQVKQLIQKVARTDANVLILGENGTGKELVARALHRNSLRYDKDFIGVDMGAISETLFESELFGYKKGAFTDAKEDRIGRFELAQKGTLFLDEIGNLSASLQAKLLAVLQNREIKPLGSSRTLSIDIRLVCATNMPLADMVRDQRFRQDLLYRINTVEIHLPPLRERREDIATLAQHYLEYYTRKYRKNIKQISPLAIKQLEQYAFPGNVRELQHAIERGVILCESPVLQPADFYFLQQHQSNNIPHQPNIQETLNLDEVERSAIDRALQKHNGNISKAAKELGLTRTSLYRRLEKFGL